MAYKVMATILKHFFLCEMGSPGNPGSENLDLTNSFIQDVVRGFAVSQRFARRQSFAYFCREVKEIQALSEEKFAVDLLKPYMALADDRIPNVRITFLRSLAPDLFEDPETRDRFQAISKRMAQDDRDRDVVIFARKVLGLDPEPELDMDTPIPPPSSSSSEC